MTDLDSMIAKAHGAAEATENQARQLEARICKIPGAARLLPVRRYGADLNPADIRKNLTLSSLIARHDHQLAAYLGCGSDLQRREAEERAAREMQAQALQMQTDRLRQVNAASARYREQMSLQGRNAITGRRYGQ